MKNFFKNLFSKNNKKKFNIKMPEGVELAMYVVFIDIILVIGIITVFIIHIL